LSEPYFLFSGCLIPTRLPYLERSSRFVLDKLGEEYEELPDATCCSEPIGLRSLAYDTWLAVTARMLSIAEAQHREILTLCNGCYMSLKESAHILEERTVRSRVNEVLGPTGRKYGGGVEVRHFVELVNKAGEAKVNGLVLSPQSKLRLAIHPGCHMLRPSDILKVDTPYSPSVLARISTWTGAEVVHNEEWPKCCGGGLAGVDDRISTAILNDSVDAFKSSGANCIVTPCPFCFVQFDLRQKQGLPVLYLSELLALAFGAGPDEAGLKYHRIKLSI